VVVTNYGGSVTSAPALLAVIPPVEHRVVPALALTGTPGSTLNVDVTDALPPASWTHLDAVPLGQAAQWYFDLSTPLPPQRFYRLWHANPGDGPPALGLQRVPALTLTGAPGTSVRIDCINQYGPTDAWITLATVTLTNTTQLYFDTSAIAQPPRLYRLTPL
jgi:hypothetical protein